MKKIYIITYIFFIIPFSNAFSQCQLIVPEHSINVCLDSPVQLQSTLNCIHLIDSNSFNSGNIGVGWTSQSGPMFTNPCGPSLDNSAYLWIGPASNFPREIISQGYNFIDTCIICFDMKYASQANLTPCEGPDMNTEGVHLQFSNTSQTGPWADIYYWDPLGGYDPILTNWNNYCFTLNLSGTVWFRWYQDVSSGNDFDHWGLDNINIYESFAPTNDIVFWSNQNGEFYNGTTPPPFYPDSSMWVTVTHDNGTNQFIDTVYIHVYETDSIYFNNVPDTLCNNSSNIILSGNHADGYFTGNGVQDSVFYPSLASLGWNNIQYNYDFIIVDSVLDNISVFYDDFSTDKGWTGYSFGGWTRGSAIASTGCSGNQDPSTDHTTTADNFIIGNYLGACYQNSLTATYWLTSPVINCSNINNCVLEFWSFSGCESSSWDHMYIDVSPNGGTSWTNIYSNTASVSESAWTLRSYPVSQADNCSNFIVRIGMGATDGSVAYSGWNIDDLSVICFGKVINTIPLCTVSTSDSIYIENCTKINDINNTNIFNISPNPVTEKNAYIKWDVSTNENNLFLEAYNLNGKLVKRINLNTRKGNKAISFNDISNGIYEIRLLSSKKIISKRKIIIQIE